MDASILQDFSTLERDHTETYKVFKKGFFTVRKTNCVFSNMEIDQAHEQKNKILKTDGGVIGILDNPTALLKWTICGPVISEILKEDEDENLPELHHEDTASFEKDFCKDRDSLIASILEYRNPFEEEEQNLVHITSRHVLDDVATKSVKDVKRIGEDQYTAFVNERLINRHTSLYDMLKRNGLSLFRQKHLLEMSKSKQKIATLNSERHLYANLYVACQLKEGDQTTSLPTKIRLSQSQYQSMVNFEKLTQSLIFFNAWNLWLMLNMMHLTYQ